MSFVADVVRSVFSPPKKEEPKIVFPEPPKRETVGASTEAATQTAKLRKRKQTVLTPPGEDFAPSILRATLGGE